MNFVDYEYVGIECGAEALTKTNPTNERVTYLQIHIA